MSSAEVALRTWEVANNIRELGEEDQIFKHDQAKHDALSEAAPWTQDLNYFKHVRISALSLLKMVMHARSGGRKEVMGLMQGRIEPNTMIIIDVFALPVEGTETQVSAQESAYNYMFSYLELIKKVGRVENVLGWYHSHSGYGCWLSGIDVGT
jgi:COP9 signalosome complex subunit 5